MQLYHTSYTTVNKPDISFSRPYLDFGQGFYLTTLREQAVSYGKRFARRKRTPWLNIYKLDYNHADWKIKIFESYDFEWLDFISNCRSGNDSYSHDMVIGGIADDMVMQTLDRYFEGELNAEQALGLLKYVKPNIQYCIRSQRMLDECLIFLNSIQL